MTGDAELLKKFVREESQDAFSEMVRRHLNMVYSTALRHVRSPAMAEEIAQSVFTDLARAAGRLRPRTILTAWLYTVTRRTALNAVRDESRRRLREQMAVETSTMNATANDWTRIEPLLDDAMAALEANDRTAVLLRYFENKSLREVGEALGTSEDAAHKRVSRAVERLREFFSQRNVTVGAGGLAVLISTQAVQSAPAGLATAISGAALAGTAISTTTLVAATKTIVMTTLQKSIVGAALIAAVGTGAYEAHQNSQLRVQIQALQQQQSSLTTVVGQLKQENQSNERQLAALQDSRTIIYTNTAVAASSKTDTNTIPSDMVITELERALGQPMWGGERDAAFRRLKDDIAPADLPQALAFLAQQTNGINTPLFDDLAVRWAHNDPTTAAQWAMSLQDTNVEERALVDVLRGWGQTAHEDAANYAAQLPAGNLQTDALKNILSGWAFNDPGAAAKWLNQNPQFANDGIGPIFFWGPGQCDDELANLLDTIGSPDLYQEYGERVASDWLRSDKWAARAWIQQAPLADSVKQKLLNPN